MEDTYDLKTYKEEYRRVLDLAESSPLEKTAEALDLYYDVCCGCVLVAEASLREQEGEWEIASLCRVLLKYAAWLEEFDHMLDSAYRVVSRFEDCLMDHPRLKLRLLKLELTIVRRIEALQDHELSHAEDLEREISRHKRNIHFADNDQLDSIEQTGYGLKKDPVEWTARWEEVIDEADRMAFANLNDVSRGMGFCFSYWHEREKALRQFGIEWRSPAEMNPRVRFD